MTDYFKVCGDRLMLTASGDAKLLVNGEEVAATSTTVEAVAPADGVVAIDVASAGTFSVALDADCTLALTSSTGEPALVFVCFTQGGGFDVTWPEAISFPNHAPVIDQDTGSLTAFWIYTYDGTSFIGGRGPWRMTSNAATMAPVMLRAAASSWGDIALSFRPVQSAPASYTYTVEILDGSTVKRAITLAGPTTTNGRVTTYYPVEEQIEDFGAVATRLSWRVTLTGGGSRGAYLNVPTDNAAVVSKVIAFGGESGAVGYTSGSKASAPASTLRTLVASSLGLSPAQVMPVSIATGGTVMEKLANTDPDAGTSHWWDLDGAAAGPVLTSALATLSGLGVAVDYLVFDIGGTDAWAMKNVADGGTGRSQTKARFKSAMEATFAALRTGIGNANLPIYIAPPMRNYFSTDAADTNPWEWTPQYMTQIREAEMEIAAADTYTRIGTWMPGAEVPAGYSTYAAGSYTAWGDYTSAVYAAAATELASAITGGLDRLADAPDWIETAPPDITWIMRGYDEVGSWTGTDGDIVELVNLNNSTFATFSTDQVTVADGAGSWEWLKEQQQAAYDDAAHIGGGWKVCVRKVLADGTRGLAYFYDVEPDDVPWTGITIQALLTSQDPIEISPLAYGTSDIGNLDTAGIPVEGVVDPSYTYAAAVGVKAQRIGGNGMTTYNWVNNANNMAKDWLNWNAYNMADTLGLPTADRGTPYALLKLFHERNQAMGAKSFITVPLAGYVSADAINSTVTPAPSDRWVPVTWDSEALATDAIDTSVCDMPQLLRKLVGEFGDASSSTGVAGYILDNEPDLWQETHPKLFYEGGPLGTASDNIRMSIDDFIDRNIAAAKVIKTIDPNALVLGNSSWGSTGYLTFQNHPDWPGSYQDGIEGSYVGDYVSFLDYYLAKFAEASATFGARLLDVLDVHWYAFNNVGDLLNTTNEAYAKALLNNVRYLSEVGYSDDSWIVGSWPWGLPLDSYGGVSLPILPALRRVANRRYAGTKVGLGEWNYGGAGMLASGIATADALGAFAEGGVYYSALWGTPAGWVGKAYTLYLDYDGAGATFEGTANGTIVNVPEPVGAHSAVQGDGSVKLSLINRKTQPVTVQIRDATFSRLFGFDADNEDVAAIDLPASGGLITLPARSARMLELTYTPRLLDDVGDVIAAFSTRALFAGYTGSLIRVRRSSDDAEREFGRGDDEWLDTAALLEFCGSGDGFVTTWYDQTRLGKNVIAASTAAQPRIVHAGVVETAPNGKPWVRYLWVTGGLTMDTGVGPWGDDPLSIAAVMLFDYEYYGSGEAVCYNSHRAINAVSYQAAAVAYGHDDTVAGSLSTISSVIVEFGGGTIDIDDDSATASTVGYLSTTAGQLVIGSQWGGGIAEVIITASRLSTTEHDAIRTDHIATWGTPSGA